MVTLFLFKMTPHKPSILTKSKYVNGLQCSKWIWLSFNKQEELPKINEATQHRFDEGHRVGELAKSLFPDGIEIEEIVPIENDKKSRGLLEKRKPLFEAGFIHKDEKCYARADILVPIEKDKWDIYEVKSATKVKEEYIWDVAFQKYCYESAGLKIRNCFVVHINNQYVKQGEIEAKELFVIASITDEVKNEMENVESNIEKLRKIIALKECPEFKKGEDYHDDDFKVHDNDKFWKEHPECDILNLYRGGKKAVELFNNDILEISKLEGQKLNDKQQIQHEVAKTGKPHINKEELNSFIKKLKYPLYFMNF